MKPVPLSYNATVVLVDAATRYGRFCADLDAVWVLVCAVCVFAMQLGFCYVEAGGVRSSSVINIIFKNMGDCALGGLCWWACGYSIAYSDGGGGRFMGVGSAMLGYAPRPGSEMYTTTAAFFLSFTYMTTAVTIVSGAIAERASLVGYYLLVVVITSFTYPLVVHWFWSSHGWLSPFSPARIAGHGMLDFSGSGVIHLYGGTSALTMSYLLGPRVLPDGVDVFSQEGQEMVAPHNKFQQATGTLLLWFSWYAFNAGSAPGISNGGSSVAAMAVVNTCVASGASTMFGILVTYIITGHFAISHACNCVLVGLVSITAGCGYMSPKYAPVVGIIAVLSYFTVQKLRSRFEIDDVLDVSAVHLGGGLWGIVATGLFADDKRIAHGVGDFNRPSVPVWTQVGVQLLGAVTIIAWAVIVSCTFFYVMKRVLGGLRVSREDELRGLDYAEHKAHSYDYIEKLEIERKLAIEAVDMAQHVAEAMLTFDIAAGLNLVGDVKPFEQDGAKLGHVSVLKSHMVRLLHNISGFKSYLPQGLFVVTQARRIFDEVSSASPSTVTRQNRKVSLQHSMGTRLARVVLLTVRYRRASTCLIPDVIDAATIKLVSTVHAGIRGKKATIHSIEGGKVTVTFQESYATILQATKLALEFRDHPAFRDTAVQASVVTGMVLHGRLGTVTHKYILTYGDVFYKGDLLNSYGDLVDCSITTHVEVAGKVSSNVVVRPIDKLTGGKLTRPMEIYEVVKQGKMYAADWLYEPGSDGAFDAYTIYRSAWAAIQSEMYEAATRSFQKFLSYKPDDPYAKRLLALAEVRMSPETAVHARPFVTADWDVQEKTLPKQSE